MIKIEHIEVFNFEGAIRGLRNPMNSWDKSDSGYVEYEDWEKADTGETWKFVVGEQDLDLMKRLYRAGTEHRKYLRQIFVSMDILAPLYWWKEFDTYKVGTVANSCSTMHKITTKEFELDDFSHEHLIDPHGLLADIVTDLNSWRRDYLKTKDKKYWWQIIQVLPSSYNQKRTVTMSYENIFSIIEQRSGHKLDEWNEFVKILLTLPYVTEIKE